jgi:hypothetical protein
MRGLFGASFAFRRWRRKRGRRTPGDAVYQPPHTAGAARAGPRCLLSQAEEGFGGGTLAFRRPTTALAKGCVVPWCDPGQASWVGARHGRCPPSPAHYSDAPRALVIVLGGLMPGPPGNGADEASPAGTALAPKPAGVTAGRPRHGARFDSRDFVPGNGTDVNKTETNVVSGRG